LTLKKT
jgi:adenine nucleotide transporter 17